MGVAEVIALLAQGSPVVLAVGLVLVVWGGVRGVYVYRRSHVEVVHMLEAMLAERDARIVRLEQECREERERTWRLLAATERLAGTGAG